MLNRSNNWYISIETSVPQQAGDCTIKRYLEILNITTGKQDMFLIGSL